MRSVLVTGGAGYIGSHTCLEMARSGIDVVVVDNLCNSRMEAVRRVEGISGKGITFYRADICDEAAMERIFERHEFSSVVHFAGLKAVGESVAKPLEYFHNNITGTVDRKSVV